MGTDEHQHLYTLRQTYRRRLRVLELQAAQQGAQASPHVLLEIDDLRDKLTQIETEMLDLENIPAEISTGVVTSPFNLSFDMSLRAGTIPGWGNIAILNEL